jgi:hypothetical protein
MTKKFLFSILFLALALIVFPRTGKQFTETHAISLAGNWRVALDVFNTGTTARWFEKGLPRQENVKLQQEIYFKGNDYRHPETIFLPGTENDGHLGKKLSNSPGFAGGLERLYAYDGILWVEQEVIIPENWNNKPVQLFLERVPGISKVWWDGIFKGESEDFATPHICETTSSAVPGKHRLTIMVNNSPALQTWSHHATNGSGARWNGIVGKIELQATERIHIKDIQVYPDVHTKKAMVKITVRNMDQIASKGTLSLTVNRKGLPDQPGSRQNIVFQLEADTCSFVTAKILVPEPVVLWDEFNPVLYELKVTLKVEENVCDLRETCFGMREWSVQGSQFLLNGQPVFLRGTLDCGQFPLKADPAMDKETWLRVLGVYKEYGLNHVRFHTWCPPEAAFQAADELGMLLQVELTGAPYSEMSSILDTYGNHPSFGMVSLQNEKSHTDITRQVITKAKEHDPRHLYCCTSHPWDPDCIDDFFVSALGAEKRRTVGIQWSGFDVLSVTRFNTHAPETESDYRDAIKGINAPMLSHEMGQWAVYPDLSEIDQYTGVLRNTNFEKIKEDLWKKGLLDQAADFTKASGKLSLMLYKEEIESTLRTPLYGGFQLLDLHDFQGQDISIIGILNAFWESKGLIKPEEFREFCSSSVPLLRMNKRVWTKNESFEGTAELAYFGPVVKKAIQPVWRILDDQGNTLIQGKLGKTDLNSRGLMSLGNITMALSKLPVPAKLQFVLEIPEIRALNKWDFWLYPEKTNVKVPENVQVFNGWGENVKKALSNGQRVLLFPKSEELPGSRVGCFTTIFWNPIMKWHQIPHTMGILCDPEHPVFADFPTESYTNWQWWDLIMNSRAMVLDKTPNRLKPLVQVVDNFVTNQKLGCLFECRVGNGKLIVCSMDLSSNLDSRPVACQFRQSLFRYMQSEKFDPKDELSFDAVNQLF